MKNLIIFCLLISLIIVNYQNQSLSQSVSIMDWALTTSGKAYQVERHMLLDCRTK